jgi:RNA polymerase sigma-70 factor (ECF subfamily)
LDFKIISSEALFFACLKEGEEAAWAEFIRRFNPLVGRVVLRIARQWGESSPEVVNDLIQDTYVKLCSEKDRICREFRPTHENSVFGYVKVFAANLARDYFKGRHALKRGGAATRVSVEAEENTVGAASRNPFEESIERNLLVRSIEQCLDTVASGPLRIRDRQIFWLYYRAGLAASAIANLPSIGLTTKGVESTILRLTRLIRARLVARKQEDLRFEQSPKGIREADSF